MFSKKSVCVPGAVILISLLGVSAVNAQSACYTTASVKGYYTVVGEYGSKLAMALGTRYFDGNGNLTGTFVINEPTAGSTTGERTIVSGVQEGTYTVNCNGTGVITRIATLKDGSKHPAMDDFVITGAMLQYSSGVQYFLATTMADAQRAPSTIVPGGVFLTRSYTRTPDRSGPSQP